MVFPGQGSQAVGMQAELAASAPVVRETYAQASESLGYDLWSLVQEGPAEELNQTIVTQPALLTAGVAAWRVWQAHDGPAPVCMAGHSLGEYTALVCADALDFDVAVPLVARRAELMQGAVPSEEAGMAAILGLEDERVIEVCRQASEGSVVEAANFNAPGQVVVSGRRDAVERAIELAKAAGARRAIPLNVSVPSHSSLMAPAAEGFAATLEAAALSVPRIAVIGSTDVGRYESVEQMRDALRRQLFSPVRWVDTVRAMLAAGAATLLECAPGKVLTGLSRRIDKAAPAACLDTPEAFSKALK